MPAKGQSLRLGKRHTITGKTFLRRLRKKHPNLDLTNAEINGIIADGNKMISQIVMNNPGGFRLPKMLGHLAITRFKTDKLATNHVASKKMKKFVPFTNLHSFGYRFNIRHFRVTQARVLTLLRCYYLYPVRSFKRTFAKRVIETGGEEYVDFEKNYFLSNSRLIKLKEKHG